MISHKHKFIFIHINKCGGTTIESVLKNYNGEKIFKREWIEHTQHPKHVTAKQYSTLNYWDIYFKFAFVRNPFAKELSDYIYNKKMTGRDRSFTEYLNANDHTYWHGNQYNWLVSKNEQMEIDYIGRVESMQHDFDTICEWIGIPQQQLPHKNKTNHKHYTEYYDDESREIVAERYAKDIELFGYKFGE